MPGARFVRRSVSLLTLGLTGFVAGCSEGGTSQQIKVAPEARKAMIDAKKDFQQQQRKAQQSRRKGGGGMPGQPAEQNP